MLHNKLSAKRRAAVMGAICESLEVRRLLATYVVPDGHSIAYLVEGFEPGQVNVHLDLPSNPVAFNFTATTGQHVIDAGNNEDFLFVDQVKSAWKPQQGSPDTGIKFLSDAGNATLRIEADDDDRSIGVVASTTTNTRISTYEIVGQTAGETHLGAGVSNLIIRTNDVQADDHWPHTPTNNPGTFVNVPNLAEGIYLTVDTGAATYTTVTFGFGFPSGFLVEEATVITGGGHSIVNTRGVSLDDQETFARVDFGDGSGAGNNQLNVTQFSTVTLAEAPNSADHVIVVEDVNVGGGAEDKIATLKVEDESEILDLQVNAWGVARVLETAHGTEVPIFGVAPNGSASIEGQSTIGTFTIEGEVDFLGTSAPTTVTKFNVTNSVTTSTGVVNVSSDADVLLLEPTSQSSPASRIGALNIAVQGKLTLQERAASPSQSTARVLILRNLHIEKMPSMPLGLLDLNNNSMIIDYSGNSPVDDIREYITQAYNVGAPTHWITDDVLRYGINSSTAAAQTNTGIGYGEATDLFSTFPVTWDGQQLNNTMILVKYTYYGDANLDGKVNLVDFNRLAANFNQTPRRWTHGDFNYDEKVNLIDFNRLAGNFNAGTGSAEHDDYSYEELEDMLPD